MESKRQSRRTPISGYRNPLTVKGKDPEYEYRIVNDVDGRIDDLREVGYEVVTDSKHKIGDKRVATPTKEGSPITKHVGNGITGVLMRIKKEWFDEDQDAKQQKVKDIEQSMKADAATKSDYGKLEIS